MAASWNNRTPTFTGLDLLAALNGGSVLDSAQRIAAIRIHSTAAETINKLSTYISRLVGATITLQLDIWALADLPQTLTDGTASFDPSGDVAVARATGVPVNTAGNLYQNIDDGAVLNNADYVQLTSPAGEVGYWKGHFNTGAGLGAGAQAVSAVRLEVTARSYGTVPINGKMTFGLDDAAGNSVYSPEISVTPSGASTVYTYDFPTGPAGGVFTEAFLVALASGGAFGSFQWQGVGLDKNLIVERIQLKVVYADEKRLVASVLASPSAEGWLTFGPFTNWAKAVGDYVATIRRVTGGQCVIPTIDSAAAHPSGHGSYEPDVSSSGVITALGDLLTPVHPFQLHTTAPADSVDSNPYVEARRIPVYLGQTVGQEVTPASTGARGLVVIGAAAADHANPPQAPLRVRYKTTASGIQQGGEAAFDPSEISDAWLDLHVLAGTLNTVANLTNGVQYDTEVLSLTPDYAAWEVLALDAKAPPLGAGNGYGGTTDRGEIAGIESNDLDFPILVATVPAAPATLTATPVAASGIGGIRLDWTATALGASSAGYIIERLCDGVWRRVAAPPLEATITWTDWECDLNVASSYRLRSLHTNGTFSLPTATATATAAGTRGTLTSNRLPSLNRLSGLAQALSVEWRRSTVETDRYGSRFPNVAMDPSDRGLAVNTKQLIQVEGAARGLQMFDLVRAMLDANAQTVPYICLRDPWGKTLFVAFISAGGDYASSFFGSANVRLVETTDVPDVVGV